MTAKKLYITAIFFLPYFCLPGDALAATVAQKPRVAVLGIRDTDGLDIGRPQILTENLISSLRKYRLTVVQDHRAVVAAMGPGIDTQFKEELDRARAEFEEGKERYGAFDSKGAETRLRAAAVIFEAQAGGLSTSGELIDVYLLLAEVFFATERVVLARDIFRRIVQLDPERSLDVSMFPPKYLAIFWEVKKQVMDNPLGKLTVSSYPTPATVYLDGRRRGMTPLKLVNIPTGVHTVSTRSVGYAPSVKPVEITSYREEVVHAKLELDRHPSLHWLLARGNPIENDEFELIKYLSDIGNTVRLDLIFVGSLAPNGNLRLRMVHPRSMELSKIHEYQPTQHEGGGMDKITEELLRSAVSHEWIPSLASRRNVAYGGGALDETARFRMQFGLMPGFALKRNVTNFPEGINVSLRVGMLWRWSSRILMVGELGLDTVVDNNVTLVDYEGNVLASSEHEVDAVYLGFPLNLGIRYYLGVSTFAPYASLGLGIRFDDLYFVEQLQYDEISAPGGFGYEAYLGGGVDWAWTVKWGFFLEGRVQGSSIGLDNAQYSVEGSADIQDIEIPIRSDLEWGLRFALGYLYVF